MVGLAELRERVRRIERPASVQHGVVPFGIAAIDRVLPGGGLARGALHEIVGSGGDEEDGALAAAFAAGIVGRLAATADGIVPWCLKRPDLYGPGLAAQGLDPGRLVLVRAAHDTEILWAMEEGLRAAGVTAAVVGEIAALPMVAGRRLQLAAERSGVTAFIAAALARCGAGGARAQPAERRGDALAYRRNAVGADRRRAGDRTSALAGRVDALPRRRAGMLGSGGGGCDGFSYLWLPSWPIDRRRRAATMDSRCAAAMASRRKSSAAPADEAPFATVIDTAGRRLLAAVNPAAIEAGLAPGMPLADALSFLPGLATAAAEPAADAAALRRLAEWCGRYSPWTAPDGADGVKIEIAGSAHLWGGEAALAADLTARLDRQGIAGRIAVADTLGAAWASRPLRRDR